MSFIVDVEVRQSTIRLVYQSLKEDYSSDKCGQEADGGYMLQLKLFNKTITNVIERMLSRLPHDELVSRVITLKDLLNEGHGSIEISEPPTEAQTRIIKSLVKVILHQQQLSNGTCGTEDGQDNLILSLFIERIYCEFLPDTFPDDIQVDETDQIHNLIRVTFQTMKNPFLESQKCINNRYYKTSLFCCTNNVGVDKEPPIEEFDKIDLENSNEISSVEGETLNSFPRSKSHIDFLPISDETLGLINVNLLPSRKFENLWESLYFDQDIKQVLYNYSTISLKISNFISQSNSKEDLIHNGNNKLLLVHGPPGTGKTTVCKALCQKLSIRNITGNENIVKLDNYNGILLEISCSRIFSRWFGESAKNLTNIFKDIENLLILNESTGRFVCLLIDEVEAIAFSRDSLLSKNETTDSVRVVSTLLTLLDSLKKYNNLLVLATSNLLDSLDSAFLDRSDGIFYIGNPSRMGIKQILLSSISELLDLNILRSNYRKVVLKNKKYNEILDTLSEECFKKKLSGRYTKKLSLKCISEHFRGLPINLDSFLIALSHSICQI
ncbi:hypothetical protein Kpol_1048p53 [Vanderwaltozyma polyspora DSM 70294]|uniref:AAA+ ATPase domain-containing protein n=1 Tax=Vanderwaltozyma polyspora (strain ATCC 22028 / DSM 70294 / BCRC 21397 / CBS 2163 / NBRC 10782 / NRRL Y-8283 / UCD 57-17) TaxID=436907 RepID=A7TGL5_VANPO|nr:uncharacterized protein Kpol_1048p53 [Vanderwaltozyma polyspora DSM 70294]EDO18622.1 hypothetical protein Kpol_1048p53 [Vanderwaltozyma polyspora DSM 70294]